jgi:hypothetical protein
VASNGNKYVLNNKNVYEEDVKYGLGKGKYTLKGISEKHPIAILNDGNTDKISYSVDKTEVIEIKVSGGQRSAVNGDYYTFKDTDDNKINIGNGDFVFMRGKKYKFIANGISKYHPFKIYHNNQFTKTIVQDNDEIELTILQEHSTKPGDLYYRCQHHAGMKANMRLLYKEINELDEGKKSYDFYYGDVIVTVTDNFNKMSIYCYYHGYMGGKDLLIYDEKCSI